MLTNLLWKSDLVKEARERMVEFEKRKSNYLKRTIQEFIGIIRENILIEASFSKDHWIFIIDAHQFRISDLTVECGMQSRCYELQEKDKDYIITEIVKHYSNPKDYEELKVKILESPIHSIKFDWSIDQISEC